ncbi:MAG: BtpA/SgcQ family protein [Bacteroidota bacterium]
MESTKFQDIFGHSNVVIACIHVGALPGTPGYRNNWNEVIDKAAREAELLASVGFHGLIIENMHDTPYLKREVGPEITASMTILGDAVKRVVSIPVGVQVLAGANKAALACAKAAGLDFIRGEGFVYGHLADEGLFESDAGELLRYRKMIDAESIAIFTDIKKKHSAHAITQDVPIGDWAKAAEFFRADGVIVTGSHTGEPAEINDIKNTRENSQLPIIIGSGVNINNLSTYLDLADGIIIGSWYKKDGYWANEIDNDRARKIGDLIRR